MDWQPIDTAPTDTDILVFEGGAEGLVRVLKFRWNESWNWETVSESEDGNVRTSRKSNYQRWREYHGGAWKGWTRLHATHWMPLPDRPKDLETT